jgi:hypothetical protein
MGEINLDLDKHVFTIPLISTHLTRTLYRELQSIATAEKLPFAVYNVSGTSYLIPEKTQNACLDCHWNNHKKADHLSPIFNVATILSKACDRAAFNKLASSNPREIVEVVRLWYYNVLYIIVSDINRMEVVPGKTSNVAAAFTSRPWGLSYCEMSAYLSIRKPCEWLKDEHDNTTSCQYFIAMYNSFMKALAYVSDFNFKTAPMDQMDHITLLNPWQHHRFLDKPNTFVSFQSDHKKTESWMTFTNNWRNKTTSHDQGVRDYMFSILQHTDPPKFCLPIIDPDTRYRALQDPVVLRLWIDQFDHHSNGVIDLNKIRVCRAIVNGDSPTTVNYDMLTCIFRSRVYLYDHPRVINHINHLATQLREPLFQDAGQSTYIECTPDDITSQWWPERKECGSCRLSGHNRKTCVKTSRANQLRSLANTIGTNISRQRSLHPQLLLYDLALLLRNIFVIFILEHEINELHVEIKQLKSVEDPNEPVKESLRVLRNELKKREVEIQIHTTQAVAGRGGGATKLSKKKTESPGYFLLAVYANLVDAVRRLYDHRGSSRGPSVIWTTGLLSVAWCRHPLDKNHQRLLASTRKQEQSKLTNFYSIGNVETCATHDSLRAFIKRPAPDSDMDLELDLSDDEKCSVVKRHRTN